jgi:glutamate synthase (NADPH/NADH) small chain
LEKVAVVGAGPAGLACAFYLAKEGVDVTIFEKESKGGGLMTYGIAAYKVTPEFCEDEVKYITSIGGIDIRYNQELGKDIHLKELQDNFDAVFLGIGVGVARRLDISGKILKELKMRFLISIILEPMIFQLFLLVIKLL